MTILLVIVLVVIAEIVVIVQVAHHIGGLATLVALVAISASGPWLVRRTGTGVWRRAQSRLGHGEVPGREIIDGVLLLAAGVLLTVPGFVTGIAGLLLLLPPVRSLVRRWAGAWLGRRATVRVLSTAAGRGPGPNSGRPDAAIPADWRPVDPSVPPDRPQLPHPGRPSDRGPGRGRDGEALGRPGPDGRDRSDRGPGRPPLS